AQLLQRGFVVRIDTRLRNGHRTGTTHVWRVLLGADHAADCAVRKQVGITTDRRSEVRVRLVIQTEVTVVVRAVNRLAQGTQHDRLDQVIVRTPANGFQQRLIILRRRTILALVQRQTQLAQEGTKFFQTLRRRTVVDAIQRRNLVLLEELGSGHVGSQHAFLDQLVRIVAGRRTNLGDFAFGAENDPGFLGFEINRTPNMTRRQQYLVQRIQLLEV